MLQALEEFPLDVARQCSSSAGALRGACADVDAGRQDDHPKLAALRRALVAARTLQAVRGYRCLKQPSHAFHLADIFKRNCIKRAPHPHRWCLTPQPACLCAERVEAVVSCQDCKVLVVGDKKAFLSMYATVSAAGMRAFQLERSDGLQGKSDDANAVHAVRCQSDCASVDPFAVVHGTVGVDLASC